MSKESTLRQLSNGPTSNSLPRFSVLRTVRLQSPTESGLSGFLLATIGAKMEFHEMVICVTYAFLAICR